MASLFGSLVFALNFNKHGGNEGEVEEPYFAHRTIHVFVHVVDIQTLFLQGGWDKFTMLSLVYEIMGIKMGAYGIKIDVRICKLFVVGFVGRKKE